MIYVILFFLITTILLYKACDYMFYKFDELFLFTISLFIISCFLLIVSIGASFTHPEIKTKTIVSTYDIVTDSVNKKITVLIKEPNIEPYIKEYSELPNYNNFKFGNGTVYIEYYKNMYGFDVDSKKYVFSIEK